MPRAKQTTAPQLTLDEVIARVTDLYERSPETFADGLKTGVRQAEYPAGRDYFGLVLGNLVVYNEYRSPVTSERGFDLNNPSFALGALIGILGESPQGRFANIFD